MAKGKLVNTKAHHLMIDLVSLLSKIFDDCPVLNKNTSPIENRVMIIAQAQKFSKMPKKTLSEYFQNVSQSTVSRDIARHERSMKEDPWYNHRFGVLSEEFKKRKKEINQGR